MRSQGLPERNHEASALAAASERAARGGKIHNDRR
jgi:hypothetical protein